MHPTFAPQAHEPLLDIAEVTATEQVDWIKRGVDHLTILMAVQLVLTAILFVLAAFLLWKLW